MNCVLQDWVCNLSLMQQSVLLTAVRGADGLSKAHTSKYLLRWLRRCIMYSAFDKTMILDPYDPRGGNFTGPIPRGTTLEQIAKEYLRDVDEIPHHFHLHLVYAAEILGYKHPITKVQAFWFTFYSEAVSDMHMKPETEREMDYRLGDSQEQWLKVGGEELLDRV